MSALRAGVSQRVMRPGETVVLEVELDAVSASNQRMHDALLLISMLPRERVSEASVIAARALREDPATGRKLADAAVAHIGETIGEETVRDAG